MKDIYIFFLDIDNTLFCDGTVPETNLRYMKLARSLGSKIFINTARSLGHIPAEVKALELDGFVAGLGCSVVIEGKKVLSENIPIQRMADIFDYYTQSGRAFMIEGEESTISNGLTPDPQNKYKTVRTGKELIEKFGGEVMAKVYMPYVLSEDEQKELNEEFLFFQHPGYAEFSKKGFTKATGMEKVLEYYGIPRSRCVAMGDSANDLDMLDFAGISVAMGDSAQIVKERCDIVTCDAADGGVGMAIKEILGLE